MTPELHQRWEAVIDDLEKWIGETKYKPLLSASDIYNGAEVLERFRQIILEKERVEKIADGMTQDKIKCLSDSLNEIPREWQSGDTGKEKSKSMTETQSDFLKDLSSRVWEYEDRPSVYWDGDAIGGVLKSGFAKLPTLCPPPMIMEVLGQHTLPLFAVDSRGDIYRVSIQLTEIHTGHLPWIGGPTFGAIRKVDTDIRVSVGDSVSETLL